MINSLCKQHIKNAHKLEGISCTTNSQNHVELGLESTEYTVGVIWQLYLFLSMYLQG